MGEHKHDEDIEGIIFKNDKGEWNATFYVDGRKLLSKIDFCPWCGEKL